MPPEDAPATAWSPGAAAHEPGRWEPGRLGPTSGAAVAGERTVIRQRAVPPPEPHGIPEWERSNGLRNALLAAAAILLVGSLIATFLIFRSGKDAKAARPVPAPALQPDEVFLEPPPPDPAGAAAPAVPATLPFIPPVTPPPAPATTAVTVSPAAAPVTAPPTTRAAPPTTRAAQPATTTTTRVPVIPPTPTTRPPRATTTTSTTGPAR